MAITTHSSDAAGFTPRAEALCLLCNSYRLLFPKSSFRDMGEYLGISTSNAWRYYYGVHSLNDSWGKGCYYRMRKGANTPLLNRQQAIANLSMLEAYKNNFIF